MKIRAGTEADVTLAATLHASQITEGFLPTLGRPFLSRLYRRVVRSPGSFLLVADDEGKPVGFIAGTQDVSSLYRSFLLRDGIVATLGALPAVARSARRVVETLRYPAGEKELPTAELLAIAVVPGARGRGAGRQLVAALTDEFQRRGIIAVKVTVGADNEEAIRLYERCGFSPAGRVEVHRGTTSQVLTWP